jgi:hypothetical protein
MRKIYLLAVAVLCSIVSLAQSKTTIDLEKKFEGSLSLYFYKNTLRMLNQKEDKDFDALIRNIEKLKFLMIDKTSNGFGEKDYQSLLSGYKKESFEPAVTSRFDGRTFDIYMNDKKGSSTGTVMLVNDPNNLFVLDMIGTIDPSKAGALFSALDGSTDIGQKIKDFSQHKGEPRGR